MQFFSDDKDFSDDTGAIHNVLKDIKINFGLMTKSDNDAAANPLLTLSDYELSQIKAAYNKTMTKPEERTFNEQEYFLYGTNEPLSVTLTHILNQKAGIGWTSYAHTGLPVPVFAMGKGESLFEGFYDNTKVFNILKALTYVK
ncbi:MAG: alkaline phosphatase [Eubacterium sp.]|nr:alkaline phosphatase [Eubacterium sp.]